MPEQQGEDRLDAILPLTAADAARAQILFRSLESFFEPLATCYVVTPDRDVASVRTKLPAERYQLLAESELIPEIGYFWTTSRLRTKLRLAGPPVHGWFVQQLVKLAVAHMVETRFYLTLDADVVCVRQTSYGDLIRDGRALVQSSPPNHPEWNDDAERVLTLPRSAHQHAVTPALLSRDAVAALARHLEARVDARVRRLAQLLPPGRPRELLASWRSFLLRSLPWTEYALYHTFLEQTGRFDSYHVLGGDDALHGNCVWIGSEFDGWSPGVVAGDGCYFSVVQSATRIPPDRVWEKVERHLAGGAPGSGGRVAAPATGTHTAEDRLRAENEFLRRRNRELELALAAQGATVGACSTTRT